jgi:hypothetical protein
MKKFYALVIMLVLATGAFAQTTAKIVSAKYVQNSLGFSVDAPVDMTVDGPSAGTTDYGVAFTKTFYSAKLENGDVYFVGVSQYPFFVQTSDLTKAVNGFASASNSTVKNQNNITLSGQPAINAVLSSQVNGREVRFMYVVTFKGHNAYQFVFGTYTDTTSDMQAVSRFFKSIELQ